ncbi:MAG: biotin--[acetyl-CoA-carboxylase] ligase [Kineosporiaceae bacterium]
MDHDDRGAFSDLSRPPLRAADLRRALTTAQPGRDGAAWRALDVVASTGSTNADVAARARAGEPEGYVLLADHQDAGRGRMARTWVAPPRSSLAVSVLLRPGAGDGGTPVPGERWGWVGLLAGLAVTDALRRTCGVQAVLKWPNDVLVPDGGALAAPVGSPASRERDVPQLRKVCGLLAEAVVEAGAEASSGAVVVGIGLNVSQTEAELPVPTATSLAIAGAAVSDRDTVARAVLRALRERYSVWRRAGGDVVASGTLDDYRAACVTLGAQVRVETPSGASVTALEGVAVDVDEEGRLLVDVEGTRRVLAAGDVVRVRGVGGAYG